MTVSPEASGMIRVNGDAPDAFPANYSLPNDSVVELEAVPHEGFTFVEWTGDAASDADAVSITLTCDQTITAVFAAESAEGGENDDNPVDDGEIDSGGDGDDGGGCFIQSVF